MLCMLCILSTLLNLNVLLQREHPDEPVAVKIIGREAGEKWKAMSLEEKEPYETLSTASKQEYARMKQLTPAERIMLLAAQAMNHTVRSSYSHPCPHRGPLCSPPLFPLGSPMQFTPVLSRVLIQSPLFSPGSVIQSPLFFLGSLTWSSLQGPLYRYPCSVPRLPFPCITFVPALISKHTVYSNIHPFRM